MTDTNEQKQWVNLNSFLAKLTKENAEDGPLDFSLYGIWMLRDAMEGEQGVGVSDYKVDTAKAWLKYSGDTLQKLSQKGKSFQGRMAAPGEGFKDKNWTGFNMDRWQIWTKS